MKIGIIGGTFNPIHYGHLIIAENAWQEFKLDKVIFVPAAHPPHKEEPVVTAKCRYQMVKMAIKSNNHFIISNIEIKRKGKSYSEDTLCQLKKIYGDKTQLYFIIGSDAISELDTWKNAKKLPMLCQFIAVNRSDYPLNLDINSLLYTHLLNIPPIAIASTEIRNRIKGGKSIKYLVPENIERYIYTHQLYQSE